MILKVITFVLLISAKVHSEVPECTDTTFVVPNFNMERFLGEWVEYYRLEEFGLEDCGVFNFTKLSDDSYVLTETKENLSTQQLYNSTFSVSLANPNETVPLGRLSVNNTYSVLYVSATDYTNFAVINACKFLNPPQYIRGPWVLRRPGVKMTLAEIGVKEEDSYKEIIQDSRCTYITDDSTGLVPSSFIIILAFIAQRFYSYFN